MRVCSGLLELTKQLDARMAELRTLPADDVARTVREMLAKIRPEFQHMWTWRRRAAVLGGSGVALTAWTLAVALLVWVAAWDAAGADLRQAQAVAAGWQAKAEAWSGWCGAHKVILSGKTVCQIPLDEQGKSQ